MGGEMSGKPGMLQVAVVFWCGIPRRQVALRKEQVARLTTGEIRQHPFPGPFKVDQVFLHVRISGLQEATVAVMEIVPPGDQDEGSAPDQILAPPGQGADIADKAGLLILLVMEVENPLGPETRGVQIVERLLGIALGTLHSRLYSDSMIL